MSETDEELRAIMQNFNEDKDKIENKIKEKRVDLDRLEANYRAMRAKHGKEGQRMGELTANRKVSFTLALVGLSVLMEF